METVEIGKRVKAIQDFANSIPDKEIKFSCNDCLEKSGNIIPPNFNYHDTGKCEFCESVKEVSVNAINEKARNLGIVIDNTLYVNGFYGREILWSDRIHQLCSERLKSHYLGPLTEKAK